MSTPEIITEATSRPIIGTEAEEAWQTYVDAFSESAATCAQQQVCYDREAFISALSDDEYVKVLARHDGIIVGFILMTNNLEKAAIANCSPEFFRKRYPEQSADDGIYYVTALAVRSSYQNETPCFAEICTQVTIFADTGNRIIAGDFTDNSTPWLADAIQKVAKASQKLLGLAHDEVTVDIVDKQYYFAISVSKS